MRDWGLTFRMIIASTVLAGVYAVIGLLLYASGGIFAALIGLPLLILLQYFVSVQLPIWHLDANKLSYEDSPKFYERMQELAEDMGIKMPQMYIGEIGELQAFAIGRRGQGKVVLSEKLVNSLTPAELEAVVAHEFSHLKNRDVIVMNLGATIVRAISVSVFILFLLASLDSNRPWLVRVIGGIASTVVHFFLLIFVRILSRYREYTADEDAVRYTGQYNGLASALSKIKREQSHMEESNLSTTQAALSFAGAPTGIFATIFATHPSIDKRISRIERLQSELQDLDSDTTTTSIQSSSVSRISEEELAPDSPDLHRIDRLQRLQEMDAYEFEHLIADIWESLGWETSVTTASSDQGIDIVAEKRSPFRQKQLIQAKRYKEGNTVSSPQIQQYSSLQHQEKNVDSVVVVTTSEFSTQAREISTKLNVKLIDGTDLCTIIQEQDLDSMVRTYV